MRLRPISNGVKQKTPKIYTKTGDLGTTTLYGGIKVKKDDLRVKVCGEVYFTNTILGLCVSLLKNKDLKKIIVSIQKDLFFVQGEIMDPFAKRPKNTAKISVFHVKQLENIIDNYDAKLPRPKHFILPGGSQVSSFLDIATSLVRKAESGTVSLSKNNRKFNPEILVYLNRLSDLLFVLARYENHRLKNQEISAY